MKTTYFVKFYHFSFGDIIQITSLLFIWSVKKFVTSMKTKCYYYGFVQRQRQELDLSKGRMSVLII